MEDQSAVLPAGPREEGDRLNKLRLQREQEIHDRVMSWRNAEEGRAEREGLEMNSLRSVGAVTTNDEDEGDVSGGSA